MSIKKSMPLFSKSLVVERDESDTKQRSSRNVEEFWLNREVEHSRRAVRSDICALLSSLHIVAEELLKCLRNDPIPAPWHCVHVMFVAAFATCRFRTHPHSV